MNKPMYPKVKVREQEQDDQHAHERNSLHEFSTPVKESENDSPPSIVRIPWSNISNSDMPMVPVSKGATKNINKKVLEEEDKPSIRASSVPRPRAVLSSPDNDGIIRSKNKTRAELLSGLKNHSHCQNRHVQCKVLPRPVAAESPTNTKRESKEAADSKNDLRGIKGLAIADPSQKAYLRKGKLRTVQN